MAALYNKSEKVRKQGGEETCDVYITVPEEPKLLNNWVVLHEKDANAAYVGRWAAP